MSEWAIIEIKWENKCEICGKRLHEGAHAFGARIGPVSRRTGQPTWVFHCDKCHETFEHIDADARPELSDELADELKKLAESAGAVPDPTAQGTMGAVPAKSGVAVAPGELRPNTLEYIKQNALWG